MKNINHKIYLFLLGGISALEELHFDKGERKHLIEHLYKSSKELLVPYFVGLTVFLTKTVPVICSFLELLFDRYKSTPIITKSVDVESIRYNNNISNRDIISTTGPSESSSFTRIDEDYPRESLVDTTLSLIQMLLLCFIDGLSIFKINDTKSCFNIVYSDISYKEFNLKIIEISPNKSFPSYIEEKYLCIISSIFFSGIYTLSHSKLESEVEDTLLLRISYIAYTILNSYEKFSIL
ncbi:hypothetical protein BCR32DRAFT_278189 [Anaeromyces robustus]|uniref:Uncharacterized protein n=1 Tax=Anaeromyces robustus TaxID=1754192 RepID=A0A1Y1XC55_9FUNG|nr:hypothetical protein BCR32DRAFT_278189 [Anaeromyces robustus]|eukprot:ORX83303.1 hypothetical protein BCR32DRAFT_278189 [Anaeromyces robustus]